MKVLAFLPLALADLYGTSYSEGSLLCDDIPGGDIITEVCYFLNDQHSLCHFQGSTNQESDYRDEMTPFQYQFCKKERFTARAGSSIQVSQYIPSLFNIKRYGCWCDFESGMKNGRGQPVNGVDQACHDIHMSYKCINADNLVEEGEECQPESSDYSVAVVVNKNMIPVVCKYANLYKSQPTCAARLCEVEAHFLLWFIEMSLDLNYRFDPSMIHDTHGGSFNFAEQCEQRIGADREDTSTVLIDDGDSEEIDGNNYGGDEDYFYQYDDGTWVDSVIESENVDTNTNPVDSSTVFSVIDDTHIVSSSTFTTATTTTPTTSITTTVPQTTISRTTIPRTTVIDNPTTDSQIVSTVSLDQTFDTTVTTQHSTTETQSADETTTLTIQTNPPNTTTNPPVVTSTTTSTTTTVKKELKCCGIYPKRFPYQPHLGKACCNNQIIFDTSIRECCRGEPDFLKDKGTC